jgi:hypothetical protein
MNIFKKIKIVICCLFLLSVNIAFADNGLSAEFFASNNTRIIDLETAYDRLTGKEQSDLQDSIISTMQVNHIEQGKFEDILGTYRMSGDKSITADNTEHFITSPYQNLADEKIFPLAKDLAIKLNQDSVAVFIPNQSSIGAITVSFTSHQPNINEIVDMLQNNLPELYSQSYSLHLINKCNDFNKAKVVEVEWLGSKINLEEVKKAFPLEKINFRYGNVYLVYQDGHKEQL